VGVFDINLLTLLEKRDGLGSFVVRREVGISKPPAFNTAAG